MSAGSKKWSPHVRISSAASLRRTPQVRISSVASIKRTPRARFRTVLSKKRTGGAWFARSASKGRQAVRRHGRQPHGRRQRVALASGARVGAERGAPGRALVARRLRRRARPTRGAMIGSSVLGRRARSPRLLRCIIGWLRIAVVSAFLLGGPALGLLVPCDDQAEGCADDDRSCHCPSGCPCSAHCGHPGGIGLPSPFEVTTAQPFRELRSPGPAISDRFPLQHLTEGLLKVPKLAAV